MAILPSERITLTNGQSFNVTFDSRMAAFNESFRRTSEYVREAGFSLSGLSNALKPADDPSLHCQCGCL